MGIAISVRLDAGAQRALTMLESSGMTRSEAIREAILMSAAALRRKQALREEMQRLEADESDRREMLEVAAVMESLRAEG